MPPKSSRAAHDDHSKSETPTHKERNGHGSASHHSNGKSRHGANTAGSHLKDVTNAASLPSSPAHKGPTPAVQEPVTPSIQWSAFNREFLHNYRRAYRLTTPTAYSSDYHSWVLSKPGSIGLHSPTLTRKKEFRRQSKGHLTNTVRKHFNSLGVQENDAIVDFLHRVRREAVSIPSNIRAVEQKAAETEK